MNLTSNLNLHPILILIAALLALVFVVTFLIIGGMMGMGNTMGSGMGMMGNQAFNQMIADCTNIMNPTMGGPMAWLWWLGWALTIDI